jgi:hypothetical protein
MPRARKHKDNAARQAAYRARKRAAAEPRLALDAVQTPGTQGLVLRVQAEDERQRQIDAAR